MSALHAVSALPVSFDPYVRQGWALVPIPPNTKGPRQSGWNKRENCVTDPNQIPAGYGVGLAHAYSGTMALDIDNIDEAIKALAPHGVYLEQLYLAQDAVSISSGNPGHCKLLYAMPFGLVLPSKKITYQTPEGKRVAYELRCATLNGLTVQDVLPPSIHPSTLMPYQWGGKGRWTELPLLPPELLTIWMDLIKEDETRSISVVGSVDASWDEIKTALYCIPASINRDDWLSCLMALHHAGSQTDNLDHALALADEWSQQSQEKYKGPVDINNCWRSFKADPDGIKIGTLFKLAKEHGYRPPQPDVSTLFKNIAPLSPQKILDDLALPIPQMDFSLWPKLIADCALQMGEVKGCDPIVPLFASIVAVCGAVDSRTRLELWDGFEVPPVLWMMTIGDPGEKKSPGSKPILKILKTLEQEQMPQYKKDLLQWEAQDALYQSTKANYLKACKSPENALNPTALNDIPKPSENAPKPPTQPRMVITDITSQKMCRMAADRPHGLTLVLDEMKAWAGKIADPRSGEDGSAWTSSYESEPYAMDRVGTGEGTGAIVVDNLAISIYGNIQPKVLADCIDGLSKDGLIQRFIPGILREEFTKESEPIQAWASSLPQIESMLRVVHALPVTTYHLSSEAYDAYRAFGKWYYQVKREEKLLGAHTTYVEAFSKLEGVLGRIALVQHIIRDPYSPQVTQATMLASIEIVKSYVIPAYQYAYGEIGGMVADTLDKHVRDYIIQISEEQPTVTLREIKNSAQKRLAKIHPSHRETILRDILDGLIGYGWIAEIEGTKTHGLYAINPIIASQFADYRLSVTIAKQRQNDRRRDLVIKHGSYTERKIVRGYDPVTMDD